MSKSKGECLPRAEPRLIDLPRRGTIPARDRDPARCFFSSWRGEFSVAAIPIEVADADQAYLLTRTLELFGLPTESGFALAEEGWQVVVATSTPRACRR
jgi:hypothetical protein